VPHAILALCRYGLMSPSSTGLAGGSSGREG
jgi:hypothetical protein